MREVRDVSLHHRKKKKEKQKKSKLTGNTPVPRAPDPSNGPDHHAVIDHGEIDVTATLGPADRNFQHSN